MRLSEALVQSIFKAVQSNASPAVWSQGVTLTRGDGTFVPSNLDDRECVVHVRLKGKALSPKVRLWPEEEDWDCDCGADLPCAHIAACAILLKRGELVAQSSESSAKVQYHLLRSPQGLKLERRLVGHGVDQFLDRALVSYVAGINSKRLKGPEVLASKTDYTIDQLLRGYAGGALERPRVEALFKAFDAEQKIFLDGETVAVSDSRLAAHYECVDEADGYRLKRLKNPLVVEIFPRGIALCTGNILRLLNPKLLNEEESKLVDGEGSFWPSHKEHVLFSQVIPSLQKKISVTVSSLRRPQALEIAPHIDLRLEKEMTEQGVGALSVLANLVYGDPPISQLNPATLELVPLRRDKQNLVILRNQNLERQLLQKLARELQLQIGRRIILHGGEAIAFAERAKEWNPYGDGVRAFDLSERKLEFQSEVIRDGEDFRYSTTFISSSDDEAEKPTSVTFENVFKAWQQGLDHVPLLDGSWSRIPKDWLQRHGKRLREFLLAREAGEKVQTHRLPELARICEDLGQESPDTLKKLRASLENFQQIENAALPQDLTAQLRDYQRQGVNWLCFLRESNLGAMLADDMGLGKTLQMLCALRGLSLIVAPTSVLFNWAAEIKKFRPGLNVCIYYGAHRQLDTEADVVLVSYGVLRLDLDRLREITWDTMVLDEAQTIKNPDSQVARAAHALRAKFRATLSGTPVENRLDDLWSQFHFLNPGFLGSRDEFLDRFARPIGQGETAVATELKNKIKPFILRRLKREVARELPPRTETVLRCELSPDERAVYESLLASTRQEVLATLEGGGGSVIKALEVILRLRQACCHTALVPGFEAESSAKIDLLMETLEESLAEGHRSLVFSQWTSFLDLIAKDLDKRGIRHSRIDGSTRDRQSVVNAFQQDDGPPVMLISLKAGGVGLTLTAADHVFITDPWWNPAVEDQAADRAHRIGQQNPVMIHKLVASDSIEERILSLQESKKDLARAVLEEGGAAANLTRDDILKLLI